MVALRLLHVPLKREAKRRRKHSATGTSKVAAKDDDNDNVHLERWLAHVRGESEIVDDENESKAKQTLASLCTRTRQDAVQALDALDQLEKEEGWVGSTSEENPWMTILAWIRELWEERVAISTRVRDGLARSSEYVFALFLSLSAGLITILSTTKGVIDCKARLGYENAGDVYFVLEDML
jgi:hypothetical protein